MSDRELIAILRGVKPEEAVEVASLLVEAGFSKIEVPLNSPEPIRSIGLIVDAFGDKALIGAGTVLTIAQVEAVASTGAKLVVSPNANSAVIARTRELGMSSYPGVLTPTECFSALEAGANGLKLFPADILGAGGVKAICAVLPTETQLYAVGGVTTDNLQAWRNAGILGFGIGSSLYKPGIAMRDLQQRAEQLVSAYDALV
ncbi:MAG TPA: 2-dehydro-3-deoxy-6-phosphogalactonate aldolase [Marinobacterium sp.]|nr:2-dehydro-3-deoxy-6-phosphogalactonate aldolase [Marinobacterium sp.]